MGFLKKSVGVLTALGVLIGIIVGVLTIYDSGYNKGNESQKNLVENYKYELDSLKKELSDNQLLNGKNTNERNYFGDNDRTDISTENDKKSSINDEESQLVTVKIEENKTIYIPEYKVSISLIGIGSKLNSETRYTEKSIKISVYKESEQSQEFNALSLGAVVDYGNLKIHIVEIGYSAIVVSVTDKTSKE